MDFSLACYVDFLCYWFACFIYRKMTEEIGYYLNFKLFPWLKFSISVVLIRWTVYSSGLMEFNKLKGFWKGSPSKFEKSPREENINRVSFNSNNNSNQNKPSKLRDYDKKLTCFFLLVVNCLKVLKYISELYCNIRI